MDFKRRVKETVTILIFLFPTVRNAELVYERLYHSNLLLVTDSLTIRE